MRGGARSRRMDNAPLVAVTVQRGVLRVDFSDTFGSDFHQGRSVLRITADMEHVIVADELERVTFLRGRRFPGFTDSKATAPARAQRFPLQGAVAGKRAFVNRRGLLDFLLHLARR